MDEQRSGSSRFLREYPGRGGVDDVGALGLAFSPIDRRVSSGIDDHLGTHAAHRRDERCSIAEVERRVIERGDISVRRKRSRQLES